MVAYYKHRIPEWMDGTEGLDDAEYRVYHVVCQLIYLNEGPISNHEVGIAGRCNMHPLKFRAVLGRLIFKKKLVMVGEKISNTRAQSELGDIEVRRRSRRGQAGVEPGSTEGRGEGQPSKPLKDNKPQLELVATREEETREEETRKNPSPNGEGVRLSLEEEKTRLYNRGRQLLGESNYGQIVTQLLKAKNGSLSSASSILEKTAGMDAKQAKRYLYGVIRAASNDRRTEEVDYGNRL